MSSTIHRKPLKVKKMTGRKQCDDKDGRNAITLSDEERTRLMEELESRMGYEFRNRHLLETAMFPSDEEERAEMQSAGESLLMDSMMENLRSRGLSHDELLEEMSTYGGMDNIGRACARIGLSNYANANGISVADAPGELGFITNNASMIETIAGAIMKDGGRGAYRRWYDDFCRGALENAADVSDDMWLMMESYSKHVDSPAEAAKPKPFARFLDRTATALRPVGDALKERSKPFLRGEFSIPYPMVRFATKKLPVRIRTPASLAIMMVPPVLFAISHIPEMKRAFSQ